MSKFVVVSYWADGSRSFSQPRTQSKADRLAYRIRELALVRAAEVLPADVAAHQEAVERYVREGLGEV